MDVYHDWKGLWDIAVLTVLSCPWKERADRPGFICDESCLYFVSRYQIYRSHGASTSCRDVTRNMGMYNILEKMKWASLWAVSGAWL